MHLSGLSICCVCGEALYLHVRQTRRIMHTASRSPNYVFCTQSMNDTYIANVITW